MPKKMIQSAPEKLAAQKIDRTRRLITNTFLLEQAETNINKRLIKHRDMLKKDGITGKAAEQIIQQISTEMWRDYAH